MRLVPFRSILLLIRQNDPKPSRENLLELREEIYEHLETLGASEEEIRMDPSLFKITAMLTQIQQDEKKAEARQEKSQRPEVTESLSASTTPSEAQGDQLGDQDTSAPASEPPTEPEHEKEEDIAPEAPLSDTSITSEQPSGATADTTPSSVSAPELVRVSTEDSAETPLPQAGTLPKLSLFQSIKPPQDADLKPSSASKTLSPTGDVAHSDTSPSSRRSRSRSPSPAPQAQTFELTGEFTPASVTPLPVRLPGSSTIISTSPV